MTREESHYVEHLVAREDAEAVAEMECRRIREADRGGPRTARTRSYRRRARCLDLAHARPLRVEHEGREIVEQWPDWFHRRVRRARVAKTRVATIGHGNHGRAPKSGRRRAARSAAARSSSDDPGGEPGPPTRPRAS